MHRNNNIYTPHGYGPPGINQPSWSQLPNPISDQQFNLILSLFAEQERITRQLEILQSEKEANRENAYSQIFVSSHQLWVPDKSGHARLLMDIDIQHVYFIRPEPPHKFQPCYVIQILNVPNLLIISEKDFYRSGFLSNALCQASKKKLHLYISERKTSDLLRLHISSIATEVQVRFYFGWQILNGCFEFHLMNGSTHCIRTQQPSPTPIASQSSTELLPSLALVSTEQFLSLMETILDTDIRHTVCLWFHAAVLTSLLAALGYRIPVGLCFYSSDPGVLRHLEMIFSWYGDPAISPANPSNRFLDLLAERKDQPLLFRDGTWQKSNTDILLNAMQNGEIPLTDIDGHLPALTSLPTLLSSSVSLITTCSMFATIELNNQDIQPRPIEATKNLCSYVSEYLLQFTKYISTHIEELREALSCGLNKVVNSVFDQYQRLNDEGITTLGILLGIQEMIDMYYSSLSPNKALATRMKELLHPVENSILRAALGNAADCCSNTDDLVSQFVSVVQNMMKMDKFDYRNVCDPRNNTPCACEKEGIVYYDDCFLSFTRTAFTAVCKACGVSGPMLLKALRNAQMLKGARVNNETEQTRITIYDAYGRTHIERVYKFDIQDIESAEF